MAKIIDTSVAPDQDLGNAARLENGVIKAFHVTDNPATVEDRLARNLPITEGRREGKYGDLGRGLYGSVVPNYWVGRATKKYDFLERLTQNELERLCLAILEHPHITQRGYLSQGEKKIIFRDIDYVEKGELKPDVLIMFADQPYNIRFWETDFLTSIGIEPSPQPKVVDLWLQGKFIEVNENSLDQSEADDLREQGFDGAFARGDWVSSPQIVVWNNEAVVKFGSYERNMSLLF